VGLNSVSRCWNPLTLKWGQKNWQHALIYSPPPQILFTIFSVFLATFFSSLNSYSEYESACNVSQTHKLLFLPHFHSASPVLNMQQLNLQLNWVFLTRTHYQEGHFHPMHMKQQVVFQHLQVLTVWNVVVS